MEFSDLVNESKEAAIRERVHEMLIEARYAEQYPFDREPAQIIQPEIKPSRRDFGVQTEDYRNCELYQA